MHYGLMARGIYTGLAYTASLLQEQHHVQYLLQHDPYVFTLAEELPLERIPLEHLNMLVGKREHASKVNDLVRLLQNVKVADKSGALYRGHTQAARGIFDDTAVTLYREIDGSVKWFLTFHIAYTALLHEPVVYISLLKVHPKMLKGVCGDAARPSQALINGLIQHVTRLIPPGGVIHLTTQSVGYHFEQSDCQLPLLMFSGQNERGFNFWKNNGFADTTMASTLFAFQFGAHFGYEFFDATCAFLHAPVRNVQGVRRSKHTGL